MEEIPAQPTTGKIKLGPAAMLDALIELLKEYDSAKMLSTIANKFNSKYEANNGDVTRMVNKLVRDGFAEISDRQDGFQVNVVYRISFEGMIFKGYQLQAKSDARQNLYTEAKEWLTIVSTAGATLAAVALLGWEIWAYSHPNNAPNTSAAKIEKTAAPVSKKN